MKAWLREKKPVKRGKNLSRGPRGTANNKETTPAQKTTRGDARSGLPRRQLQREADAETKRERQVRRETITRVPMARLRKHLRRRSIWNSPKVWAQKSRLKGCDAPAGGFVGSGRTPARY